VLLFHDFPVVFSDLVDLELVRQPASANTDIDRIIIEVAWRFILQQSLKTQLAHRAVRV